MIIKVIKTQTAYVKIADYYSMQNVSAYILGGMKDCVSKLIQEYHEDEVLSFIVVPDAVKYNFDDSQVIQESFKRKKSEE